MQNYCYKKGVLPSVSNGAVLDRYNLEQLNPHTKIFEGVTGLVFRNCRLINCDLPADAVKESCTNYHVERCYHLHPDDGLTPEVDNCPHVVEVDTITIDGQVVDTVYHRQDKVVA